MNMLSSQVEDHKLFLNPRVHSLLRRLKQSGERSVAQPLKNKSGAFFKRPFNHEGGRPNCVVEFDELKNVDKLHCVACSKAVL
jgi:hypothetical protein